MSDLAFELGKWTSSVQLENIPAAARQAAVRAIIDTAGVILAGATDEIAPVMRRWVTARPRSGGSVIPPFGDSTDPENAALVLGVLAHALDLDDIHPSMIGHPSAVLVPTILALGPFVDATNQEAIAAYVVGAELAAHLGKAVAVEQYRRGWHTTATIGVLAAAVCAARLLKLSPEQTAESIRLAASTASGLRGNFGSHAKPLHAGYTAYHGVSAALLAREGLRAASDVLEGPLGYLAALGGDRQAIQAVPDHLGSDWELIDPGLQIKLYACCGAAHRPVDALTTIVNDEQLTPDEVELVLALVDPLVPTLLVYSEPASVGQVRFSLHHCLAAVLADRTLSLAHFTPEAVERADLKNLRQRIQMQVHPTLRDYVGELTFAEVQVFARNGRTFSCRVEHPRGSGERPLTKNELATKFLQCARLYAPHHSWESVLTALEGIDGPGRITDVVDALVLPQPEENTAVA